MLDALVDCRFYLPSWDVAKVYLALPHPSQTGPAHKISRTNQEINGHLEDTTPLHQLSNLRREQTTPFEFVRF